MSEENKEALPKPEHFAAIILFVITLAVAGVLVSILSDINAPGIAYAFMIVLSVLALVTGAAFQENYRLGKARDKKLEELLEKEPES